MNSLDPNRSAWGYNNPYWMLGGDTARKIGNAPPSLIEALDRALGGDGWPCDVLVHPDSPCPTRVEAVLMEEEGDPRLRLLLDLLDWATATIEGQDFGGRVRVTQCQAQTHLPSDKPQLLPHADVHNDGMMFTLTVRTGPGVRFRIGGMAETSRSHGHDETAVDLDMKPGELWAWNWWEVHSASNSVPGDWLYLLIRANHDGSPSSAFDPSGDIVD